MSDQIFIDLSYLKNVCNKNMSLFKDFLSTYIKENKRYTKLIVIAIEKGEKSVALEHLHKLKGLSASMGISNFANQCKNLESMLKMYDTNHPKVQAIVTDIKLKQKSTLSLLKEEIS